MMPHVKHLAIVLLLGIGFAPAWGVAEAYLTQYISSDWVAIYQSPNPNQAAITHLVTNTKVQVIEKKTPWCKVKASAATGYMACKLLSDRAITLLDIENAQRNGKNDQNGSDNAKAFWIAPSFNRFAEYGRSLNYSELNAKQQKFEQEKHQAVRFAVPQFDVMKNIVTQAIHPNFVTEMQRVKVSDFGKTLANPQQTRLPYWLDANNIESFQNLFRPTVLPNTKPSFFIQPEDIVMLQESTVDMLAGMLKTASVGKPKGKPKYSAGRNDEGIVSLWDIGYIQVTYPETVTLYAISRNGLIGARTIEGDKIGGYSYDEGCLEGYNELPKGKLLPDYPKLKDHLLAFYTQKKLEYIKVVIVSRKLQIEAKHSSLDNDVSEKPSLRPFLLHSIDLNNDAIADIAVIEGKTDTNEEPTGSFYFFVNINGEWWLSGYEEYAFCS